MAGVEDLQGGRRMNGVHDNPQAVAPWRDPLPRNDDSDTAKALLIRRVPFNAVRMAQLADIAAPLPRGHVARPANHVPRNLP
jgi:hypothetical protein